MTARFLARVKISQPLRGFEMTDGRSGRFPAPENFIGDEALRGFETTEGRSGRFPAPENFIGDEALRGFETTDGRSGRFPAPENFTGDEALLPYLRLGQGCAVKAHVVKCHGSYGTLGAVKKQAVITFDLDGTLVQPQGGIHPQDIRLLCSEQPYWFIPATGRPLHSTRALLAESGLFIDQKLPLPLIQQNGAALYRPYEELLDHTDLPEAALEALAERLAAARQVTVLFLGIETIAALRVTPYGAACIRRYFPLARLIPWSEKIPACNKVMCLCEEHNPLQEIFDNTKDLPLERAFSMDSILEFTAAGVNKGAGLLKLLEALGAEHLPLLAAGDGGNDLEMLKKADLSFAPSSSPAEIRRQADYVVDVAGDGLLGAMIAALRA